MKLRTSFVYISLCEKGVFMVKKTHLKCIAGVITLFMIINISVFAQNILILELESASADKGQRVAIKVNAHNAQNMKSLQFTIKYDKDNLSVAESDIKIGNEINNWIKEINVKADVGEIIFVAVSNNSITTKSSVEVCSIVFEVSKGAPYEKLPLVLDSGVAGDKHNQKMLLAYRNGEITVENSDQQSTPTPMPTPDSTNAPESIPQQQSKPTIVISVPKQEVQQQQEDKLNFQDLNQEYDWAAESIQVLTKKGIIKGTSDTTFEPSKNITRADYMELLIRLLDIHTEVNDYFDDIAPEKYYYIEISGSGLEEFSDKDIVSEYAREAISKLVELKLVIGNNNAISPLSNAKRAEAAVFIMRLYNYWGS